MRVVLQRVKKASVAIADQTVGQIDQGLLLLVGFQAGDGSEQIDYLVKKIANCR
ncbi:D-aminoacyl-tRNA deacylase, partial [Intestinimonas butyriciproducens]|nr:D-tyrosyl-tRNA(Tyr) deacylase [Intestinimonas butyriciproducens]